MPRDEFELDDFENGARSQLASRGLFGAYRLYVPAQSIRDSLGGSAKVGLDLGQVDDILVRIDYVAASQ